MKKKKLTPAEQELLNRKASFQEHLPIEEITQRLYKDKNGLYYPAFKMGEKTLDLMTLEELDKFSNDVQIHFASMNLEACQFLTVPTPFDIGPYKKNQQKQKDYLRNEINKLKAELSESRLFEDLSNDIAAKIHQYELFIEYINNQEKFITDKLKSGLAAHKECIVIPVIRDAWNPTSVEEAALNIEKKLREIAPESHRCSEQEMRDILYSILNPIRKEVYKAPATQYVPSL